MIELTFFTAKGIVAFLAVVLLVVHMTREWDTIPRTVSWRTLRTSSRHLRYLALLSAAFWIAWASADQVASGSNIEPYHLGAFLTAALIFASVLVAFHEDRTTYRKKTP